MALRNRSTPYISRLIKQTTGKNFTDLLTDLRIQKAKELLKTSSYHVNEISHMVGYPIFVTSAVFSSSKLV